MDACEGVLDRFVAPVLVSSRYVAALSLSLGLDGVWVPAFSFVFLVVRLAVWWLLRAVFEFSELCA